MSVVGQWTLFLIDENSLSLPDCPDLLSSLLGFDTHSATEPGGMLIRLAVSMRAHGRGGSLLVVPRKRSYGGNRWYGQSCTPSRHRFPRWLN
jgi:hypothetical protein